MQFLSNIYANQSNTAHEFDTIIKWSRNLKRRFERGLQEPFDSEKIKRYSYRPFGKFYLYYSKLFVDEMGIGKDVSIDVNNLILAVNTSEKRFGCLVSNYPMDLHCIGDNQCFPLNRYASEGDRVENITDWALGQFQK
jgi:predicted helicase